MQLMTYFAVFNYYISLIILSHEQNVETNVPEAITHSYSKNKFQHTSTFNVAKL